MARWRQSDKSRADSVAATGEPGVLANPAERRAAPPTMSSGLEGAITGIHDGVITGWAWDSARPYEPIGVDLFVENALVGQGTANLFDLALAKANRGNGMHRFEIRLERLPAKSPPFEIRSIISGTDVELLPAVSVATLADAEQLLAGNEYLGEVTGISNGAVCGWVFNRRNSHEIPFLTLRDGDRDVAGLPANDQVSRVLDSGVTLKAFRFELPLPQTLLDGKLHVLTVLVGAPNGRPLGSQILFGASDFSSLTRALVSVSERLEQVERKVEALKPTLDFAQFERRITSKIIEPMDMLLNVHRDSLEREMAVFRRQITNILHRLPNAERDVIPSLDTVSAIEDVAPVPIAAFDPVDRSAPLVKFDLSTRPPLVQPSGELSWLPSNNQSGIVVRGDGALDLEVQLSDRTDVVMRGHGAVDASELSAIVVRFNGKPMSGRFDVFADGRWAFVGSTIESAVAESPAKPRLSIEYLAGIARPSRRLDVRELVFFAPGRAPARVDVQTPTATIVNLGRESIATGWHSVEAGPRGGICWMGETSDVSLNVLPTRSYSISIPEIRPLVAGLMSKLRMFLDGEPVSLEIRPMAGDSSAYMARGRCLLPNGSEDRRSLRISFPVEHVKSPMELGLNPDLRPLTIAVRCIMLAAAP